MFQYVHHVHYVVNSRDEMVKYLEDNFGMKPAQLLDHRNLKEALYDIDKTQLQISEPLDPNSSMGQRLANKGPHVLHVAWGVNGIHDLLKDLTSKGNKFREESGIHKSPLGYATINIDRTSSHGLFFQLAEGSRELKR